MEDNGMGGFYVRSRSGGGNNGGGGGGSKCGRWNPTSEQVKVLTELFRSGLRTPSTDQIQKISSQLSFYGKIESKNVFYWFQNHKARERQKRRRVNVVDERKDQVFRDADKFFSSSTNKYFQEINHQVVGEPAERSVRETLQLFPLNSRSDQVTATDSETKFRLFASEGKENSSFAYHLEEETMDHPTLDLRLNFL